MNRLLSYITSIFNTKTFLENILVDNKWKIEIHNENEIINILKKYVSADIANTIIEINRDYKIIKIPIKGRTIEVLQCFLQPDFVPKDIPLSSYPMKLCCPLCENRIFLEEQNTMCATYGNTSDVYDELDYTYNIKSKGFVYLDYCFNCGIGYNGRVFSSPTMFYHQPPQQPMTGHQYMQFRHACLIDRILENYYLIASGLTLCEFTDNDIILGETINVGLLRFKTYDDFLFVFRHSKINITKIPVQ